MLVHICKLILGLRINQFITRAAWEPITEYITLLLMDQRDMAPYETT